MSIGAGILANLIFLYIGIAAMDDYYKSKYYLVSKPKKAQR